MPLPLLMLVGTALVGGLAGALTRQPEINRLHAQIGHLQMEIQRLQRIIEEQNRQIQELTLRYKALKGYQFVERSRMKAKSKGAIMFQWMYKEYMDLLVANMRSGYEFNQEETVFVNAFDRLMTATVVTNEEKIVLRTYIRSKYAFNIDRLENPRTELIVREVESLNVA